MKGNILQGQFENSIDELKIISQKIGSDLMLVQGAGGNTSLKTNGKMWVKASGKLLARAIIDDIFVPIDYLGMCKNIDAANFEIGDFNLSSNANLRPSIETPLHAVHGSAAVIHAHSIHAMTAMTLIDCHQYIAAKLGNIADFVIIDYIAPGIELARAIKAAINKAALEGAKVPVIFMKNHGIVIGAQSPTEAFEKLLNIERLIEFAPRNFDQKTQYSAHESEEYELLPNWSFIAFDDFCISILTGQPLFPDQAVYLGANIPLVEDINHNHIAPLVIVKNQGLYRRKNCDLSTIAIIEGILNVCIRIPHGARINSLGQSEVAFLLNWDAEKYRKAQLNNE